MFHGEQRLKPEELHELDPTQTAQLTGETCKKNDSSKEILQGNLQKDSRRNLQGNSQKRLNHNTAMSRDLLKNAVIRTNGDAYYILHLGLEPQSWIDYAMPVRAEERINTARRMFENGIVYDIVRACTDQLVSDQTLHEIQSSVLAAQNA